MSSAATASQPFSRSAAGIVPFGPGWLGSAAMLVGSLRDSLPVANTTRPSRSWMKKRYSSAIGAVAVGRVQYRPPQELFMIRMPALARSWWIDLSPSAPVTSLPWPEPSSVGRSSLMIRADRMFAPGATPPGQLPNACPAASWDTVVPWPTLSSTLMSFLLRST